MTAKEYYMKRDSILRKIQLHGTMFNVSPTRELKIFRNGKIDYFEGELLKLKEEFTRSKESVK